MALAKNGEGSSVGRVPGCGSGCRGFNPRPSPQKNRIYDTVFFCISRFTIVWKQNTSLRSERHLGYTRFIKGG